MRMPFACVLINGCVPVRCPMPPPNGQMSRDFEIDNLDPPPEVWRGGQRCFNFTFRFSSPNLLTEPNVEWHGMIVLDDGMHIDLGCIRSRCQTTYTEVALPRIPLVACVFVSEVPQDPSAAAPPPEEDALLDYVRNMMEDDKVNPRHGSLPASLVQSLAMRCDCFEPVTKKHGGFIGFIKAHPHDFTTFNYSREEIAGRDMKDCVHPGECRIVLRTGRRVHFVTETEEDDLTGFLKETLKDRDLTSDELLLKIHDAGLGFSISPSFSQLMRFLTRNKDLFSWSTDPSQVTMVSLNSGGTPAPTGRQGGGKGKGAGNDRQRARPQHDQRGYHGGGQGKGGRKGWQQQQQQQQPQQPQQPQHHAGWKADEPQRESMGENMSLHMNPGPCIYPVSR